MKNPAFYDALIRAIEKIYYRIASIVLRKRMDGYRKQASQGHKLYANGIQSPLLDYIDDIIASNADSAEIPLDDGAPVHHAADYQNTVTKRHTDTPPPVDRENAGGLSRHFRKRTGGSELYPEIANKLVQSIWEHIHATTRYARQGDKYNATMHTDIANSACKELAHYMSEERYQGFIMEIAAYLDALKPDQQGRE